MKYMRHIIIGLIKIPRDNTLDVRDTFYCWVGYLITSTSSIMYLPATFSLSNDLSFRFWNLDLIVIWSIKCLFWGSTGKKWIGEEQRKLLWGFDDEPASRLLFLSTFST